MTRAVWLWLAISCGALTLDVSAQLHVGDPLPITVTIPACDSIAVQVPPDLPIRALPLSPSSALQQGGTVELSVAVYETGTFTIPPLGVTMFRGGHAVDTVWTTAREVEIASVLADTTATPQPIKPYREHPLRFADLVREYWTWAAGALALALLIYAIMFWRKRRSESVTEDVVPQLPADVIAFRQLNELRDRKYPERGMLKEHYSEYSEIMRRYVEGRYCFPALEMTTHELTGEFERGDLPDCWQSDLLPILRTADLVKFAKEIPTPTSCGEILETGFRLIAQTKEVESPVVEQKAA